MFICIYLNSITFFFAEIDAKSTNNINIYIYVLANTLK